MLSGYRVFSRRFVKSFPALAVGFETETEFTIHALELKMPIGELPTCYRGRAAGSRSKLHTISDGLRILRTIMMLVKQERPLQSFGLTGATLLTAGLGLASPVVCSSCTPVWCRGCQPRCWRPDWCWHASLAFVCGLVLEQVARGRKELKRLAYLSIPARRERTDAHRHLGGAAGPPTRPTMPMW